ncbi:ankyrin repeat domain-containing protein SOWAHC-like [Haliotis rubra]|uniref:ankyrin repeat domain-containing protein SOWAHC-like n=1 Tax=Haliotis rubra TaxID=36100 RepID=UPI001EE5AC8E|nr:ankyrin repeat domain-containing protein SOWAHC-like [Haliotis rubra]
MAAREFTLASVKDFMINNGGRVKNHQLVTHFKAFLNDQSHKAHNREKFKDYVNELATIKVEDGEKVLVLKKKFRPEAGPVAAVKSVGEVQRAQSEPPSKPPPYPPGQDEADGVSISKGRSEGSLDSQMKGSIHSADSISISSLAMSTTSIASTESQGSGKSSQASTEEDQNMSVLSGSRGSGGDDDDSQSGTSFVTLEPEEREWMLTCCHSEYHDMNRLLSKNPQLAKLKNFTNGYTALHWACKHGKADVVKLVASKPGVSINSRTHGGYTPLHMAAIHGHEDIISLLVQTYRADANVRDFSGKKAKQYLKNSASTKAQQLLLSRTLHSNLGSGRSLDDSFMRTMSFRKSHRTRAISSLLQATSSIVRTQTFRSSWDGSSENLRGEEKSTPDSTPPSSTTSSPSSSRKGSFSKQDRDMMPPPSAPTRRKKMPASGSGDNLSMESPSEKSLGSRSESDPSLTTHSAKTTFI